MAKFRGTVVGSGRGEAPSRQGNMVIVEASGKKIITSIMASEDDEGRESYQIGVGFKGYFTVVADITDRGDGDWVLNVHEALPGKLQFKQSSCE